MKAKASILNYALIMGLLLMFAISCDKDDTGKENPKDGAIITTSEVSRITRTTAYSGGNITDDGGSLVTARGVCWSKKTTPSIRDNKTEDGTGAGSFSSDLKDLEAGTTYHVRAYATNKKGTSYGNTFSFKTNEPLLPLLLTTSITDVSETTAVSGGEIIYDGDAPIISRGVCWSTHKTPTIDDCKTNDGEGKGIFVSNIIGLTEGTTYYVRAYATNIKGVSYGDIISFNIQSAINNEWKNNNEVAFAKTAASAEYKTIASESKNGSIAYKVIKSGSGKTPLYTDRVKVLYTGWFKLIDWNKDDIYTSQNGVKVNNKYIFDSTANRNDVPSIFRVSGVVDGFSNALQHMKVGDKWEVWMPWELGYGANGQNTIPAYTTLVFEIELLEVL